MSATDAPTIPAQSRAPLSWWAMLKITASQWIDDDAMTWAAAVACYALLALAPLLVIAVKVTMYALGGEPQHAADHVSNQAAKWMGPAAANAIHQIVETTVRRGGGMVAALVSAVIVVLSVGGVFAELQQAMNGIWKVKVKPGAAVFNFLRARLKSVVLTSIAAVLLLASIFVVGYVKGFISELGVDLRYVGWAVDVIASIIVLTLLFAMLYRTVPDAQIAWKSTWVGAFITAILFDAGKYGLALYFKFGAPTSAYGAVGSLAAILIWIYYSAQIVFFGAEFTRVYARAHGHGVHPSKHARFIAGGDNDADGAPGDEDEHAPPPHRSEPRSASDFSAVLGGPTPNRALAAPARRPAVLGHLLSIGVGLGAGAWMAGFRPRRRSKMNWSPSVKDAAAVALDQRMKHIERKLGRLSRIRHALTQEEIRQRLDALGRKIDTASRHAAHATSRGGKRNWLSRLAAFAKSWR